MFKKINSFRDLKDMEEITWAEFSKIEMRVGTVLSAKPFEKARNPSYILEIDFGDQGVKKSSAQITKLYNHKELVGKQIIAVVNFPPKQIANIMSQCLVMGAINDDQSVTLLGIDKPVKNGVRIG